ncbi:hypothetical protein SEA_NICEHOUSE_190 [Rhodococcus phage NiceHouse]|nr:hypothetical protein SEA_NICEHOUSE_190 [Rhodococcus phage NiceHouse]
MKKTVTRYLGSVVEVESDEEDLRLFDPLDHEDLLKNVTLIDEYADYDYKRID